MNWKPVKSKLVVVALGKLVTEKSVVFDVVESNQNQQNDDDVVKASKAILVEIHWKEACYRFPNWLKIIV